MKTFRKALQVIRSYPNIPDIIDAQKNASEESGAAFWDAYSAMGGESSIIKWFERDPPLAKKDFVHFTDQGADTLAKMMVSDLFTPVSHQYPVIRSGIPQNTDIIDDKAENTDQEVRPADEKSFLGTLISDILTYSPGKPFIFTSTCLINPT